MAYYVEYTAMKVCKISSAASLESIDAKIIFLCSKNLARDD